MGSKKRGRPLADFASDRERWGVVLLDAQLRFAPLRGVRVREWQAAQLSAASLSSQFHVHGPTIYQGPPPTIFVGSGLRKSPTKRGLRNGYVELEIVNSLYPKRTAKILNALADRLRRKRRAWRQRPNAQQWLSEQSFELAKTLYSQIPIESLTAAHRQAR
jgi:hypothetical protein